MSGLWSTIVYIFTEAAPYSGQNPWQIITALTAEQLLPTLPESVPAALRGLLKRCFTFEAKARPQINGLVQQLQVRGDLMVFNISSAHNKSFCVIFTALIVADFAICCFMSGASTALS